MQNSLGSSQGDLWLKGQSCFWFPLSALAEHEGSEGDLWVRSERSLRGQAQGHRDPQMRLRWQKLWRNPGVRNSDCVPTARPWRGRRPRRPLGMEAHSGHTMAQRGFGHCSY